MEIRPEIREQIAHMQEKAKPHPKDELDALADELLRTGKADDHAAAKALAAKMRPDLFQAWKDLQKEVTGGDAQKNGHDLLVAAFQAEMDAKP
jgi:hypothetical protein